MMVRATIFPGLLTALITLWIALLVVPSNGFTFVSIGRSQGTAGMLRRGTNPSCPTLVPTKSSSISSRLQVPASSITSSTSLLMLDDDAIYAIGIVGLIAVVLNFARQALQTAPFPNVGVLRVPLSLLATQVYFFKTLDASKTFPGLIRTGSFVAAILLEHKNRFVGMWASIGMFVVGCLWEWFQLRPGSSNK